MIPATSLAILAAGVGAVYRLVVPRAHVPDPQAVRLYQQGRRDIQEFTEHGFKQSIVDFSNAIKRRLCGRLCGLGRRIQFPGCL